MYVAISTNDQTGDILGKVEAICDTQQDACAAAKKLNTKNGFGVIRRIVFGRVQVGESVGFFDERLRIDQPPVIRKPWSTRKGIE